MASPTVTGARPADAPASLGNAAWRALALFEEDETVAAAATVGGVDVQRGSTA
jgi:hypothetical protein